MDKFKNSYCRISVLFATLALLFSIVILSWQDVYATGTLNNPPLDYDEAVDGIEAPSGDDIEDPVDRRGQGTGSSASGSTNGVTFSYNNEEGTLSFPLRRLC